MALTVLWWRAGEEIRRANIEMQGTRIVNAEIRLALDVLRLARAWPSSERLPLRLARGCSNYKQRQSSTSTAIRTRVRKRGPAGSSAEHCVSVENLRGG